MGSLGRKPTPLMSISACGYFAGHDASASLICFASSGFHMAAVADMTASAPALRYSL